MRAQAVRRAKSGMLDDEDLQQLILERFDEDPAFWTGTGKSRVGITVEVDDGHVRLSGVVRSALDRRRADILARALGAAGVDNRLRVSDEVPSAPTKPRRIA
jgi:osmotically-inducible protein OsmY